MRDTPPLRPLAAEERSEWLDALRGFALLGILVVNIRVFSGVIFPREFMPPMPPLRLAGWDEALTTLAHVFAEGKFYSLFSFLFGLGLMLLFRRADDADARAVARRRLGWLMVFGLLHGLFLWAGDILLTYGVFGFALLWFRRLSTRQLLGAALFFIASPVLVYLVYLALHVGAPMGGSPGHPPADPGPIAAMLRKLAGNSYADLVQTNAIFSAGGWMRRATRLMLPRIFGMFLLGMWAARIGLPAAREALQPMLRRWLVAGIVLGLPMNIAFTLLGGNDMLLPATPQGLLIAALAAFGMPLLCLAYVAAFALFWLKPAPAHPLVCAGRTALSHYLAQSVVCGALFYGIGFGLFGRVSYAISLGVAFLVFLGLAFAGRAWLRTHAQGPMESLWRRLSYGRARLVQAQTA